MNPEYSYQTTDTYKFPRTALEVMDDHIALYPEGKEFRCSIIGLHNYYNGTPLMSLMHEYARFMKQARVEVSDSMQEAVTSSDHDPFFLAGSVMAMHTMTYGASTTLRRRVLSANPLQRFRSMPECEEKIHILEKGIKDMCEWDAEGAQKSYETQTDEFKEKLLELSIYLCNDMEKPQGKDTMFISGFMFASELIWRFAKGHGPPV